MDGKMTYNEFISFIEGLGFRCADQVEFNSIYVMDKDLFKKFKICINVSGASLKYEIRDNIFIFRREFDYSELDYKSILEILKEFNNTIIKFRKG